MRSGERNNKRHFVAFRGDHPSDLFVTNERNKIT